MVLTPALIHELIGFAFIAVPVLALFALCELLYHVFQIDGELTRKTSHVGSGLIVFSMPWFIHSHWTVLALAGGFAVILGGSKILGLLPSVHRVARQTRGAEYYPIAVYLIFWLAHGNPLLFGIPMLVMAFSDTGAALVGQRYGIVRYRVVEDYRSLGGSVTFFGLTFAVVLVGLGIAGFDDLPSVLLITLLTAIVATAVEGVSVHGADNILVPYATFMVLSRTITLDRDGLSDWILGTALILGLLLVSYRQSRLNATAFMATFVGGVLAWGLGGPVWLATLLVPYIGFAAARPLSGVRREADLEVVVPAFALSLSLVLIFAHSALGAVFIPFLGSVATVSAIAVTGFAADHLAWLPRWGRPPLSALAAALTLLPASLLGAPLAINAPIALTIILGALLGPALTQLIAQRGALSPVNRRLCGALFGTVPPACWVFLA